jgi:hypothetical protein
MFGINVRTVLQGGGDTGRIAALRGLHERLAGAGKGSEAQQQCQGEFFAKGQQGLFLNLGWKVIIINLYSDILDAAVKI